jgi:PAS domain S-box-containing protein
VIEKVTAQSKHRMRRAATEASSSDMLAKEAKNGSLEAGDKRIAKLQATIAGLRALTRAYEGAFYENPNPAIIFAQDNFRILEANKNAVELYGYTRKQMCKMSLLELFSAGEGERARGLLEVELRKPYNTMGPFVHRGAAGRELVVSMVFSSFAMKGRDARLMQIQDETTRRTAEEAVRASEERYRELFENANDVIFLHDLKGKLLAINRAAESLTGYTRAEVLGKSIEELIAPESRHLNQDSIRSHLGGSTTQHFELRMVSKSGEVRFLEVSTRIIYRKGHAVAIQGIGRDVTERKLGEQKLRESACELQVKNEELSNALRLAREATRIKEQFLANTSHELRTPMNGIMGMIDLMKTTDLTPAQREYADAISQCANDLLTIINDLLDLSQIGAGRLAMDYRQFDPAESLRAVIKMLSLRASTKGLALSYEVDPQLPAAMECDSVRFRQILTNLIANALKFTSAGGVHVVLATSTEGSRLHCEVVDTGIGVDETLRERIFEAFFQADGTNRRRFGGTGLGLTISRQLVELMGGQIGMFNNAGGNGATFWFSLPLSQEAAVVSRIA